jgi:hypothetical protein
MDAKMRNGHFTPKQRLRLRVKMAALKTALAGGLFAFSLTQTLAAGLPVYDTNLERWAKESLAKRIGDIRDSYEPSETLRMVTETDVKRGPLILSAERNNDPIWKMATLRIGEEANSPEPVSTAEVTPVLTPYPPREAYTGALMLAGN